MPELPEVETTRRGIAPHILGKQVTGVTIRERKLRWPIPSRLPAYMKNNTVRAVSRRAKYLLVETDTGTLMIHLGMSGSLRIVGKDQALRKHDHVDITFADGSILRYHDPRKFGSMHWITGDVAAHPLLCDLGPEPLADDFSSDYLFGVSRKRKAPVKTFIMDSHVVVGVGNIYASESLFRAGIHPKRRAGRVSAGRMHGLAVAIKSVLVRAIEAGGTTLRDFHGGDGEPGYFRQQLDVYDREGLPCRQCETPITAIVLGQRSTFYCKSCQR